MEQAAKQVARQGSREEGNARTAPLGDLRGAAQRSDGAAGGSLPPLPQRGDRFTEDQLRERFGVPVRGGIRTSPTSSDIILVHNVRSGYNNVEDGRRVVYDCQYYEGKDDQMIRNNLELARSQKDGRRVLYFLKRDGVLEFYGLVEHVATQPKEDPSRRGALVFELRLIDGIDGTAPGRPDGRADPPGPAASSAPDLGMITRVEDRISDRRRFSSRSELLAALPSDIDSAKLDQILEYLERSAKIAMDGGPIRWSFAGAGSREDLNAGQKDGDALAATEDPVHILSMEERLSPDLDNDLPYSAEVEQAIADCKAGRSMGKTYTAEEYRRHLRQEYGIGTVEYQTE